MTASKLTLLNKKLAFFRSIHSAQNVAWVKKEIAEIEANRR